MFATNILQFKETKTEETEGCLTKNDCNKLSETENPLKKLA